LTAFDEDKWGCAVIFAELAGFDEGELTGLGCPVIFDEVDVEDLAELGCAVMALVCRPWTRAFC